MNRKRTGNEVREMAGNMDSSLNPRYAGTAENCGNSLFVRGNIATQGGGSAAHGETKLAGHLRATSCGVA